MAYTAQEVAAYLAANPQLSPDEILSLAQSNGVGADVLFQALNVDGGQYQGVAYDDVAAAYQAAPVQPAAQPAAQPTTQATTQPLAGANLQPSAGGQTQYIPGQITDQQLQQFFAANPNISDEQTYALMQQYQVSPEQIVNARGLDPQTAYGRYNQQVVNEAQPGQVTDYQLQAYFANNPNIPDEQVYALMNQYKVTPEQVSRAIGIPLSEAQDRYRSARYANIPTGVGGAEDAQRQGLADATGTLRGAETSSRFDITDALQKINQLYGVNITDLQSAADRAISDFQPYYTGGTRAFGMQEALSGSLGVDAFNKARQESPYEKFLFDQGMRANLAGAAATGGLGGGNVQKELQRFGQDLSSQGLQQQINNLELLSGRGFQAASAMGDIRLNTAQNIAGQRGDMASYQGQAGAALSNIGQNTGMNIAEMQYGTGRDIALGRSRAAEQLAGQIERASLEQSRLLSSLGEGTANLIGDQATNLINMQNAGANRAALNATGLAGNVAELQAGLAENQMDAYGGATRINAPSFDYEEAFNAAAGGADFYNQLVNAPRKGGLSPVSDSAAFSRYGPYRGNYSAPAPANPFSVPDYRTPNFRSVGP
jgi:uncharacterized protein YneF (UPF0154 family)